MKKLKIFIIIIISVLAILTLIFFYTYPCFAFMKDLNEINPESYNMPAYVVDGILYIDDQKVCVSQVLRKIDKENSFNEVLCVYNEVAYFVYSTNNGGHTWHVAAIDLSTEDINDVFSIPGVQEIYRPDFVLDYAERDGYYHDGKIVLNDTNMVYEYMLSTGDLKMYRANAYNFPEKDIDGEFIDDWTIAVTINSQKKVYTLEEMAEESVSIAQIYTFKDRKIWDKSSALSGFQAKGPVQFNGDTVYALCPVYSYSGNYYTTILEFVPDTDSWVYVGTRQSGFASGPFQIIENVT